MIFYFTILKTVTINYENAFTLESLERIGIFNRKTDNKIIIDD